MSFPNSAARIGACLFLGLLLSGCFSFKQYESPTTGPMASLEFQYDAREAIGGGGIRRLSIGEAEGCTNRQWHDWRTPAKLRVNKPLFVIQGYQGVYGGGCSVAYSFTPKAGEKYISEFIYGSPRCRIKLLKVLANGAKAVERNAKQIDMPNCWGT